MTDEQAAQLLEVVKTQQKCLTDLVPVIQRLNARVSAMEAAIGLPDTAIEVKPIYGGGASDLDPFDGRDINDQ